MQLAHNENVRRCNVGHVKQDIIMLISASSTEAGISFCTYCITSQNYWWWLELKRQWIPTIITIHPLGHINVGTISFTQNRLVALEEIICWLQNFTWPLYQRGGEEIMTEFLLTHLIQFKWITLSCGVAGRKQRVKSRTNHTQMTKTLLKVWQADTPLRKWRRR